MRDVRLHHLAFRTRDLATVERFYVDVLGFAVTRRSERSVWLDAAGTILMLERAEPGEATAHAMELTCFAIAPDAYAALAPRLPPLEGRTAATVYFRDPDGRRVGLSAYPATL